MVLRQAIFKKPAKDEIEKIGGILLIFCLFSWRFSLFKLTRRISADIIKPY